VPSADEGPGAPPLGGAPSRPDPGPGPDNLTSRQIMI